MRSNFNLQKFTAKNNTGFLRSFIALGLSLMSICTFFVGCSNRKSDEKENPPTEQNEVLEETPKDNATAPPNPPEDQPPIESEEKPKSGANNEADKPKDKASGEADTENAAQCKPQGESTGYSSTTPGTGVYPDTLPAAGVDLAQFAGIDNAKSGWGPGGPVDEDNRSLGAISCQEKYSKYNADFIGENVEKIYLTFDEGYENGYTAKILDVLKEKQVPAVFFVTMPYAKSNPDLIRRMVDEGHQVGNHSVNHPCFPETPLSECQSEITELHHYIKENFNYTMKLFRFPMGEYSEQSLGLVQKLGYRSVFWSFAYRDWLVDEQPDHATATETILKKAHPGEIMLLHAVSKTNTEILPTVIDSLVAKGFVFAPYPV